MADRLPVVCWAYSKEGYSSSSFGRKGDRCLLAGLLKLHINQCRLALHSQGIQKLAKAFMFQMNDHDGNSQYLLHRPLRVVQHKEVGVAGRAQKTGGIPALEAVGRLHARLGMKNLVILVSGLAGAQQLTKGSALPSFS